GAAFGKVRQRMRPEAAPARRSRMTRRARTKVFPEPALAETQADALGSEASVCALRVAPSIVMVDGRARPKTGPPRSRPGPIRARAPGGRKDRRNASRTSAAPARHSLEQDRRK